MRREDIDISDEEIVAFFLAAMLNGCGSDSEEYIQFRYDYWKGDPRIQFSRNNVTGLHRGLPVSHPLSIDYYDIWMTTREVKKL